MKNDKNRKDEENKRVLNDLSIWIKENWQLEAKMVRRSSPDAMAEMNEKGWGPEAFYLSEEDKKSGKQLAVLVYFNGEIDYEVCAYPQESQQKIEWVPLEKKNRTTFDPKELNPKFRFGNIQQFKKEFLRRFLANDNLLSRITVATTHY